MRRVVYALTASVALMFGATTQASAGCYGYECDGYRDDHRYSSPSYSSGYSERPYYGDRGGYYTTSRYYEGAPRYHTTYYERGPEIQTGYYERPAYSYRGGYSSDYNDDGYADSYAPTYRSYSGGYGYGGYGGYRGYGYGGGYGYRGHRYGYGGGYGYSRYRYGHGYGNGYGHGYGHGYGYGYRPYYAPTIYSGGALLQTAGALGFGGYGCSTAYIPYGWTWQRASSC
jgi:hypothetical protein